MRDLMYAPLLITLAYWSYITIRESLRPLSLCVRVWCVYVICVCNILDSNSNSSQ